MTDFVNKELTLKIDKIKENYSFDDTDENFDLFSSDNNLLSEEIFDDLFDSENTDDKNLSFDNSGLNFASQVSQICSYSSSQVTDTISLSQSSILTLSQTNDELTNSQLQRIKKKNIDLCLLKGKKKKKDTIYFQKSIENSTRLKLFSKLKNLEKELLITKLLIMKEIDSIIKLQKCFDREF